MPSPYELDLALALALADTADTIALARFGAADLVVEAKPDLTPVSDADRAVEQALRDRLAWERPDDAVIGEEFGEGFGAAAADGSRQWVIDPIDGTKNYVRGVPVWATLIGLLIDGVPACGVVSAPALARRWWAASGGGAWATFAGGPPRALSVSRVTRVEDASVSYSSLGGWAAIGRRASLLDVLDAAWRSRAFGDFWSYMLVAEGAVDAAAEPELSLWDVAALAPIVVEAGGRFSGLDGVDGVHQGNALASNGLLHERLLLALAGGGDQPAS